MNDQLPPGAVLDKDQLPPGAVLDENQLPPGATIDINPDPAAEAAFDRARGVPLYTFAPGAPPQKELPPPGEGEGEPKKDIGRYGPYAEFGKQLEAGYYGGLAPVDRLTGGIAHLLDTAATKISGLTGLEKNGLFKQIEDWAKEQQKYREEQAAELAGGRRDLSSQLTRGAVGAVMSLPVTAAATTALGPVGGMATLGALETADQGPGNMLKGAAEGALMGKFLHVLGPYGRPIRIPAVAGAEYVKNIAQGVDPETALANALNMGALTAIGGPGTKKVRDLPGVLPETLPEAMRFKPTLNPVQQRAVDYLSEQGVPLTGFQQTGNRFLGGIEATTAHTPLGSQRAREFHAGTQEAMADLAGELAGQVHAAPVTKYEGGKAAADALDRNIASLHAQETDAYGKAWQHAGKPEFDKNVVVKNETEPLFDEAGEPTGERQVPTTKDVNMPVDVRWMKEIARDEIPNYRFLSAAEQSQSKAYSIYKNLLKMDDYITAQQAEKALQGLKSEAGYNTDPNLRNESQAASARVIPRLQRAIDAAVAETGPDAVAGLQAGRRLHAEKEGIAEVSKKLRDEPVQAFNQLAMAHDAGVDFLKAVAKEAPDSMPKVGRAYLDHLFDEATKEGGWMRADGVFRQWDALGPQTKALLFPNEGMRQALDRFFLASKITSERINTSGTQLVKAADDAGINALKWFKGKVAGDILFSPRGIKFLTGIAQNPPRTSAQTAALKAQAEKVFGPSPKKPPEEPPPPATPPTGGGPTPSPTGGGGGAPPEPAPGASNRNAFIDRLKEFLGSEEGASPSRRGRPMGLQELMGQPEKVLGGEEAPRTLKLKPSGKGGELLTSDLGQALENSVAQRYRLGKEASPERRQARGLEAMTADLRYALAEEAKGRGWYTDDVAEMERHLKQARPEFKDPNTMGLFKYLLGITSNGVDPELNFDAALRGWDLYKRDGKFSAYDASRASEFGNPKGTGLTFRANSYASAMDRMTKLVEDKGEAGALEWLRTKHPVSELKQYYEDVPGKATDERYGSYIFGEKVGSFGANLNGIHTELTADKWWSRSWNRWMGTLMDTDKEGNVRFDKESGNPLLQDDPRNETERNLMRDTAAQVAKDLGLQVSELQAILWYAEQRLYRFYGIDASSVSYADAARKQFGTVRPSQNAVDSGSAKSGGTNAQPRKGGRSPAKVP